MFPSRLGCLRKWLLEYRESRNFIRKWSYFREISSNFVYFRITFYTTFRIIWHDFHTKFHIPSNKNLTNNKYLWNLGLYWVLKLYKNKSVRLPLHPATRPSKTHSMAVRAIPLSVCHHGPPNGYRTGFKRCSDVQLFIQLTVVDDINAKAVEAWKQKRSI